MGLKAQVLGFWCEDEVVLGLICVHVKRVDRDSERLGCVSSGFNSSFGKKCGYLCYVVSCTYYVNQLVCVINKGMLHPKLILIALKV
jgi:hypothetical protein